MNIGAIGGTGQLGKAIAKRLSAAGHAVTIGSRSIQPAQAVAAEIGASGGATYADAASDKDVVIVAVPLPHRRRHRAMPDRYSDTTGFVVFLMATVP